MSIPESVDERPQHSFALQLTNSLRAPKMRSPQLQRCGGAHPPEFSLGVMPILVAYRNLWWQFPSACLILAEGHGGVLPQVTLPALAKSRPTVAEVLSKGFAPAPMSSHWRTATASRSRRT